MKPRGSREWYKGVIVKIREPSPRDKVRVVQILILPEVGADR